ncbi:MAG: hypothetical protein LCH91_15730 [Bacteroidetes bacterium]|nr:hypothetical protein [Bacteroidota bacterium]
MSASKENEADQYAYKAFIRNIYLALPNYTFKHHPIGDTDDEIFLGRNNIIQKLLNVLEYGDKKGAYLVTGYRGMGKTSFVKKAINKYKEKEDNGQKNYSKVISNFISFAQDDLKELDILRQITKFIKDDLLYNDRLRIIKYLNKKSLIFLFASSIFFLSFFKAFKQSVKQIFNFENIEISDITSRVIFSLIVAILIFQGIQIILLLIQLYPPIRNLIRLQKQVDLLYDRCQGEISNEKGVESTSEQLPIGFTNKKSKKYQPLTPKEAEHELIDIFKKYDNLSFYKINIPLFIFAGIVVFILYLIIKLNTKYILYYLFNFLFFTFINLNYKYEVFLGTLFFILHIILFTYIVSLFGFRKFKKKFIFAFDELDKLDPQMSKGYFRENIAASTNLHYNTYTNDLRERKQVVLSLLSSMKYFITEANARFIFIAGREMFDASLADIADRQSSISSIFHQVIYIDSFYRDKPSRSRASGIGEMVEEYLETILIDKEYKKKKGKIFYENHFLGNYYEYLNEIFLHEDIEIREAKILKIIFTLQNLIIYITYRSNGSPKKMVRLLEESIVTFYSNNYDNNFNIIVPENNKTNLYLKLSYKKQYKLGFTSYMFRPFLLMYGTFLKQYGDSLLVSTPYLIDNLIKFHPFAFSVKNLELLPEVISSSKTPELRLFIEELIFFLSQNHIRETESGLFEYKFYDKTHNEIAYISKVSEEESAAFNFTLDENYPIKRHLAARIKELRNTHKDFKDGEDNFSMSLAFLNDLLGDAELYDDEFEDAIISYSDALQGLPKKETKELTHEQLVLSVRFRLKLGLTYEKMKSYDVALSHYTDALLQIKSFFELHGGHELLLVSPSFRELLLLGSNALAAVVYVQEKLDEGLTFQKLANFSRIFNLLLNSVGKTPYKGRDVIEANHYAQIATIAFYKNMSLPVNYSSSNIETIKTIFLEEPLEKFKFVEESFKELSLSNDYKKLIFSNRDFSEVKFRDFRFSFIAYVYYKKCLSSFLPHNKQSGSLNEIVKNCFEMIYNFNNSHDKNLLRGIADCLTRLGDLLLTLHLYHNKTNSIDILKAVLDKYKDNSDSIIGNLDKAFYESIKHLFIFNTQNGDINLDGILLMYYLSGRFYLKSGRSNSSSFQFRKILLVISSFTKFEQGNNLLINWLEKTFLKKILEISSWNNNSSDRPQILKFKDYIGIESVLTPKGYSKYIYLNLSNNPETKEALLLIASMKVKADNYSAYESLKDFNEKCKEQSIVNHFNNISHQFTRIIELDIQVKMNYKYLKESISKRYDDIFYENFKYNFSNGIFYSNLNTWEKIYSNLILEIFPNKHINIRDYVFGQECNEKLLSKTIGIPNKLTNEMIKLLQEYFQVVANSIYCLHQIISSLKIYGTNHFLNNAYLASFHEKMACWLKHYRLCKILDSEHDLSLNIDETFNRLLGFRIIHTLEVVPQYQLALQYYYRSLQVHSEGSAYKYQISNFIYLEDDYNDNLYHFGAALERQRINSDYIRNRLKEIEKETRDAGILKYDMFINAEKFPQKKHK